MGGNELLESTEQEDEERRALDKRKYLALNRRCKEIEQVCAHLHIIHSHTCVRNMDYIWVYCHVWEEIPKIQTQQSDIGLTLISYHISRV